MQGAEQAIYLAREAWFWAGVLRDHALFIHDNLVPGETQLIQWAASFQTSFSDLHDYLQRLAARAGIRGPAGSYALTGHPRPDEAPPATAEWAEEASRAAGQLLELLAPFRTFKQQLLQAKLDCRVALHLSPTLLQHMINEANEAYRALGPSRQLHPPALEALHLHMVWLADASGHAAALNAGLDPTEGQLDMVTRNFKQVFDGMHLKAVELQSMLQIAPRMVEALRQFNRDAGSQINAFRIFLTELREHLEGCRVMGDLIPRFADHMLREELYYLEKLTSIGEADIESFSHKQ